MSSSGGLSGGIGPLPRVVKAETATQFSTRANSTLDAGHGWVLGGTTDAASSLNYTGDQGRSAQCIKIVTNGAGASARVDLSRQTSKNLTGQMIRFWYKIDPSSEVVAGNTRIQFAVGSGASAMASESLQFVVDMTVDTTGYQTYAKVGEWVSETIQPAGFGLSGGAGFVDWTAVQDYRFQVVDGSKGKATVYFGGMEFVPNDSAYSTGVVSFTFDDGYAAQSSVAAPYLARYGYRGTAYVIQDRLDTAGCLSSAQLQSLRDVYRWEVGPHAFSSASHNSANGFIGLGSGVVLSDWQAQRAALQAAGYKGLAHWAAPQGKFDPSLLALVRQNFASMRTTIGRGVETAPPGDPFRLRCNQLGSTFAITPNGTVGTAEWIIDQVAATGGWAIFLVHDIQASASDQLTISTANFQALVDYVNTKAVPVRTVGEVLGV